jgi:microcystin-dependent protein
MAIGDYTRTTWVDTSTPALNASNLNNSEAKILELDDEAVSLDGSITTHAARLATLEIPGEIKLYAGASVPSGYLLCDGQAVSRTTYAALFTAISTTWGIGNNSTTFNVPDLREAVPVGVGTFSAVTGTTRGAEAATDIYTLGQFKDDQMQTITGTLAGAQESLSGTGAFSTGAAGTSLRPANGTFSVANADFSSANSSGARTGTVTRTKQIGVNYIIRY